MVYFYFFESQKFSPKGLGLGFLTRISASRILPFATPSCHLVGIFTLSQE